LVNDPAAYDSLVAALGEIRGAAAEAKTFIASSQAIVNEVKSGRGTLGSLVFDQQTGEDIRVVARNLRSVSDRLSKGEGTLGRLLTDDTLYRDAQGVMRKVDRAVDGLTDQGPITAVGVAANALF
jgi:phospholipid/cholesterol/gamma-HCH transport system substrate-binding protein